MSDNFAIHKIMERTSFNLHLRELDGTSETIYKFLGTQSKGIIMIEDRDVGEIGRLDSL